jgi:Second Messenger Oligonucleotide or Dinucleotide Synthetase domain
MGHSRCYNPRNGMATTIPQGFLKMKQNLEITDLQAATVSTRQKSIRDVLEAGLIVHDSFLTGSYSRNTMIAPLKEADIDIFFVMDVKYYYNYNGGQGGGQAGLLDLVKRTLKKTYTRTPDISRNGQAVSIRFDDFVVDVVPGFNRQGGGYLIPNSLTQSWISTDPKKHVELIRASNQAHAGDLVPLVKMIKGWNKGISSYFRAFHLEVLALEIFNGVTISDFPSGARFYFDKGRALIAQKNPDPAGYGDDVGRYITAIDEATGKFQLAYDRAVKAEDYAKRGYIQAATDMWIKIFGDYFPAYG